MNLIQSAPATRADQDPRTLHGAALIAALRECRAVTWSRVEDLDDNQWRVPRQPGINPLAWELAHIAWFAEFWILRGPHTPAADGYVHAGSPPRIAGPDALFDSARLAHALRWDAPLPARAQLHARLAEQLEACIAAVPPSDADPYFHRLALFHEDMHGEAFAWLRATLGLPAPRGLALTRLAYRAPLAIAAGEEALGGARAAQGFAFDNELPGRRVELAAFEIDATPVSAGALLRFVEAGGYDDPRWWPGAAGTWRAASELAHPQRWRRHVAGTGTRWEQRWFDRWIELDPDTPAIHLNAWEAEAYAQWAGRRLPSAAEWEHAARSESRFAWGAGRGDVWEWTADAFLPHAGFAPGPYRDYSAPWFGNHRELRGGAFATHARMHDARYRNFFSPERTDIFAGFRTAAR